VITRYDRHVLRALLCGHDLNGEVDRVSPEFKAIAEHLAGLAADARQECFEGFRMAHPDGDEILAALEEVDLTAPFPEADETGDEATEGDDWDPVRLAALPPVEPFPLEVLAPPARALAESAAVAISCPVDFVAVALLAAASGLVGRSVVLLVKAGYLVSAALYAALVGTPSSGKSPALHAALAPLWVIAGGLYKDWQDKKSDWEKKDPEHRGEEPRLRRLVTSDPTTEALGPILSRNPRGLTVAPDEMTKWVLAMDQYKGGRGADRPFYLSAWGNEPVIIDRAKHMQEPIAVPDPYLTIIGGITPGMLSALPEGKGRDDGFLPRLLFTFPDRSPRSYSEQGIPEAVAKDWQRLADALWERQPAEVDGRPSPHEVRLTPEAAREWADWVQTHYGEQEADDFPSSLEAAWGKLEAYTVRLALVLHMMQLASDPTRPTAELPPALPRRIMTDAIRLTTYFKSNTRRVAAAMGGRVRDGGDDVKALVRWIIKNELTGFSVRDVARNFSRFDADPASLGDALEWMAAHNLIRPRPAPKPRPGGGRPRSPAFDVNPALRTSPQYRHYRQNPPFCR
jgi:hypothetical protein